MHIKSTSIRGKDKAIFAVHVELTNRSLLDIAIFQNNGLVVQTFYLGFTPTCGKLSDSLPVAPIILTRPIYDGTPLKELESVEIAPNHSINFCLKKEDYISHNYKMSSKSKQWLSLKILGSLAWKRSTGLPTPFNHEKDGDIGAVPAYYAPSFDLGVQEIMIHKNFNCEDAGK